MNLNVLKDFPFSRKYYICHPWRFFHDLFINIKNFWYRGTKGFAPIDVWNFDDWFCTVVPDTLRYMAKYHAAYPGTELFDTSEKWEKWLYEMADNISNIQCDTWYEINNEYSKAYIKTFEDGLHEEEHPNGPFLTTTSYDGLSREEIHKKYYEHNRMYTLYCI